MNIECKIEYSSETWCVADLPAEGGATGRYVCYSAQPSNCGRETLGSTE